MFNSWDAVDATATDTGQGIDDILGSDLTQTIAVIMGILLFILIAILVYAFFKWQFSD